MVLYVPQDIMAGGDRITAKNFQPRTQVGICADCVELNEGPWVTVQRVEGLCQEVIRSQDEEPQPTVYLRRVMEETNG